MHVPDRAGAEHALWTDTFLVRFPSSVPSVSGARRGCPYRERECSFKVAQLAASPQLPALRVHGHEEPDQRRLRRRGADRLVLSATALAAIAVREHHRLGLQRTPPFPP